jgi:hypothetical protein
MRFLIIFLLGCPPPVPKCGPLPVQQFPSSMYDSRMSVQPYSVNPTQTTPKGIKIDAGGPLNLARVDRLFDEVEACLAQITLDADTMRLGQCSQATFPLPINRACLTVKIERGYLLSRDGSNQVLPIYAGTGCASKGEGPHCFWRAIVQDGLVLVTPPSMYLLKDVIIRVATGCLNPWAPPKLATCATPSTGPLDDGTGP